MISVGLDVGGTKVLGVAVDEKGTVRAEERRPTADDGAVLLDDLAELYHALVAEGGGDNGELISSEGPPPVGIGVPGLVNRSGTIVFAPNLPGVSGTDIHAGMTERLRAGRPVVQVDNDATCAAAGESAFGAGAGRTDVLFVTLGTGIGGGIVAGGRLLRGSSNFAGEIGHMVVDPAGPECGCGRTGCWEQYASGSGLRRLARTAARAGRAGRILSLAGGDASSVQGEHVIAALSEGDSGAETIVREFAWWLALGLANLANVLDPRVIVIGGGLVRAGEALLGPVRAAFMSQIEGSSDRPRIEILAAALADQGGAVGAAVIGFEAAGAAVLSRVAQR